MLQDGSGSKPGTRPQTQQGLVQLDSRAQHKNPREETLSERAPAAHVMRGSIWTAGSTQTASKNSK